MAWAIPDPVGGGVSKHPFSSLEAGPPSPEVVQKGPAQQSPFCPHFTITWAIQPQSTSATQNSGGQPDPRFRERCRHRLWGGGGGRRRRGLRTEHTRPHLCREVSLPDISVACVASPLIKNRGIKNRRYTNKNLELLPHTDTQNRLKKSSFLIIRSYDWVCFQRVDSSIPQHGFYFQPPSLLAELAS